MSGVSGKIALYKYSSFPLLSVSSCLTALQNCCILSIVKLLLSQLGWTPGLWTKKFDLKKLEMSPCPGVHKICRYVQPFRRVSPV